MFVRTIKGKRKEYVSVVRSFRDAQGKTRQKVVFTLGHACNPQHRQELIQTANRMIGKNHDEISISNPQEICEIARINWGAPAVINKMWHMLDMDNLNLSKQQATKLCLIDRFLCPRSKLSTWQRRGDYEGMQDIKLHDVYRALDELDRNCDKIKAHIFHKQAASTQGADVMLFDVTTLYFESHKADDLRDFGYSKDCKFNEVQVVLCLVIDTQGTPLTYDLFPGNVSEGATLLPALERLRDQYGINRAIIVADRAMGSADNLKALKAAGFGYIIGAKLGNASAKFKQEVISDANYCALFDDGSDQIKYKYMKRDYADKNKESQNWLCLYSSKRASKDRYDREKLVQKAEKMINTGARVNKRGAHKYIKQLHGDASLDIEKIHLEAQYDGYYALSFSDDQELSPHEIVSAYRGLWRIEESFRHMKSFFQIRPMWHWTQKRIGGHVMLNFIALVIERRLEHALRPKYAGVSVMQLRDALSRMEYSNLKIDDKILRSYAEIEELQVAILEVIGGSKPQNSIMGDA